MILIDIINRYQSRYLSQYQSMITSQQHHAMNSILACKTAYYGEVTMHCHQCNHHQRYAISCGNRNCPNCQHHDTERWLQRQQQKLMPLNYFMVTFTLPKQLRNTVLANQTECFNALFKTAQQTLAEFAKNDKRFNGTLGMTGVLHTHSRRLDYHPHVHFIVPAGAANRSRQQWQSSTDKFLFNSKALAKVFRAKMIHQLTQAGLSFQPGAPKRWVVDCKLVGNGLPALKYLSRYLYRGPINPDNIVSDDGVFITFKYLDSRSKSWKYRRLRGEQFLWLLFLHVLPKGFRRSRDYGFLHGNAKKLRLLIHWILQFIPPPPVNLKRSVPCSQCGSAMTLLSIHIPSKSPG